jgi:DNA-binding MarR family transcriptional regulator
MSETSLEAIGRAMNRIGRTQTRRALTRLSAAQACGWEHLSLVPVLEAVDEGPGLGDQPVTVGLVAHRIGLDPSRASRLVTSAIREGFLVRLASQSDGRSSHLALTPTGTAFAAETRKHRDRYLADVLAAWSEDDRAQLARLLDRFADDLNEHDP